MIMLVPFATTFPEDNLSEAHLPFCKEASSS